MGILIKKRCFRRSCRAAAVGLLLLAAPSLVSAHALLVDSTPKQDEVVKEAPTRVVLKFNARIEKPVSHVTLLDPNGRKVPLPPLPPDKDGPPERLKIDLPALKPGAYKLEYRVLASDGHATPGLLRFTVAPPKAGDPAGPAGGAGK